MLTFLLLFAINPDALADHPAVASVRVAVAVDDAALTIIHLRDWHLVREEAFSADTGLEGDKLANAYAEHKRAVEAVQASQRAILADVGTVYLEGLTAKDMTIYGAMVRIQAKRPDPEGTLRIGAAGQLMADGKLTVKPAEGKKYFAANPVKDGKLEFDANANEAREDAIVRNLMKRKGTAVLILGGAHDLADNVRRLAKDCRLVVVTPKGYPADDAR